jgi:hypothetical protein
MFSATVVQNCGSVHDNPVVNYVVLLHVRFAEVVRKAASHGTTRAERWDFQTGWKANFELRSSNGSVVRNARPIDIINKVAHVLDIFHNLPSVKDTGFFNNWSLSHYEVKGYNSLWCTYFSSKTNQTHQFLTFIYFVLTLYMLQTVFPSIIRSSRLYIQQLAYVRYCYLLASVHLVPASKQIAVSVWHMLMLVTVCTGLNSWWWTERPSQACTVLRQNK